MTIKENGSTLINKIEPSKTFNHNYIKFLVGSESAFGTFSPMKVGKNGQKLSGDYSTRYQELTDKHYLAHLRGEMNLGIFPTPMGGSKSKFACIDLDVYSIDYKKLRREIDILDLPLIQTMSKSRGCHLWLLMKDWTDNQQLIWTMEAISYGLGFEGNEIFPKQTQLKETEVGNFINAPLHGNERLVVGFEGELGGHQVWVAEMLKKTQPKYNLPLLQLLGRKDKSGGRNNRLWTIGRYLKASNFRTWISRLKDYNKLMVDPLPESELQKTIIKSLSKSDYDNHKKNESPVKQEYNVEGLSQQGNPRAWKMRGISGKETIAKEFADPKWLVKDIINAGLTIFGGKAKSGKSFFLLDLGICVQNGLEFMNQKTLKGNVAHYALEDGEIRVNRRIKTQKHLSREKYPLYHYKGVKPPVPKLMGGLEEEIDDWFSFDKDNRLVMIDTYSRVKNLMGMHKCNAHEIDCMNLQPLQEVAIKYPDRYIIMAHHTKKKEETDTFDNLSGSVGIQSSSDGMLVLTSDRKVGLGVSLDVMPRDGEQLRKTMKMNSNCIWEFQEDCLPPHLKVITQSVKKLTGWTKKVEDYTHDGVTPSEVAKDLKIVTKKEIGLLSKRMTRLVRDLQLIKGKKYGSYLYVDTKF